MKYTYDIASGVETYEPLTESELAQIQANELAESEAAAKATASKAALLARLGITEDEAKLLLS